jgi:hypothetical protein
VSPHLGDPVEAASAVEDRISEHRGPPFDSSVGTRVSNRNRVLGGLGLVVVLLIVGLSAYFVVRYLL